MILQLARNCRWNIFNIIIFKIEGKKTYVAVLFDLLDKQGALLGAQLELLLVVEKVEVLEDRGHGAVLLGEALAAHERALEVVRLVDLAVWREHVAHDHKVQFGAMGQLDTVQTAVSRKERVGVVANVLCFFFQHFFFFN